MKRVSKKTIGLLSAIVTVSIVCFGCYFFSPQITKSSISTESQNNFSESVKQEISSYISENNITNSFSDEDLNNISNIAVESVNEQLQNTGSKLNEQQTQMIRDLVNQKLQSYNDSEEVQKSINEIVTSLSDDINDLIAKLGVTEKEFNDLVAEYEAYKTESATTIEELNDTLIAYDEKSQQNIAEINNTYKEFNENYSTFVKNTDILIENLDTQYLSYYDEYNKFIEDYENYSSILNDSINEINSLIEENKEFNDDNINEVKESITNTNTVINEYKTDNNAKLEQIEYSISNETINRNNAITDLNTKVDENNTNITISLANAITAYENSDSALLNKINSNTDKITSETTSRQSDTTTLTSKITSNTDNISTLDEKVDNQNTVLIGSVANNANDISTLDEKVDNQNTTLTSKISSNTDNISALDEKVDNQNTVLIGSVANNANNISTLNEKVDNQNTTLTNKISSNTDNISVLDEKVDNQNTTLTSKISSNTDNISTLDEKVDDQNTSISTLDEKVDNQNTSLLSKISEAVSTSNSNDAELEARIEQLEENQANLYNNVYPVGSVYMSFDGTDPSTKFGGTWEKLESGRMLMSGDVAGQTGGNNSVRLESSQIPSLSVSGTTASAGNGMSASISSYTYADRTGSTSTNGYHTHSAIYWKFGAPGGYDSQSQIGVASMWNSQIDINADINGNFGNKVANNIYGSGDHTHTVYYRDYYANGVSVSGLTPHTHTFTGNYTNNNQQSIDITNKYITVFMWKRVS